MLLTNTSVAMKIPETFPQSAVFRFAEDSPVLNLPSSNPFFPSKWHPRTILRYPAKVEGSIVKHFKPGHLGYIIGQVSHLSVFLSDDTLVCTIPIHHASNISIALIHFPSCP
jgi:hypothetical protein